MLGHRKFDDYMKARFITAQIFAGMTSTSGTSYHCANFNNLFFQVIFHFYHYLSLFIINYYYYYIRLKEERNGLLFHHNIML